MFSLFCCDMFVLFMGWGQWSQVCSWYRLIFFLTSLFGTIGIFLNSYDIICVKISFEKLGLGHNASMLTTNTLTMTRSLWGSKINSEALQKRGRDLFQVILCHCLQIVDYNFRNWGLLCIVFFTCFILLSGLSSQSQTTFSKLERIRVMPPFFNLAYVILFCPGFSY